MPAFPAMSSHSGPAVSSAQRKGKEMDIGEQLWPMTQSKDFLSWHQETMWITHTKTTGIVTSAQDTSRSYLVSGPQGTGGRKRRHLVPMPADNSSNTKTCCRTRPAGHSKGQCSSVTRGTSGQPHPTPLRWPSSQWQSHVVPPEPWPIHQSSFSSHSLLCLIQSNTKILLSTLAELGISPIHTGFWVRL